MTPRTSTSAANVRRAFSLVEILLAIGILGIGLVMVATVFPVGADWTRRGVNDSLAQVVAQNALAILQAHYPFGGPNSPTSASVPANQLTLFPSLNTVIPISTTSGNLSERCYNFGANQPCPGDPSNAQYFWTALIRASSDQGDSSPQTQKYDVYILVFKKGDVGQTFTTWPSGFSQFQDSTGQFAMGGDPSLPTLAVGTKTTGTYNSSKGVWTTRPIPNIGEYGIGFTSGTGFRQYSGTTYSSSTITVSGAVAQPGIATGESIIYAPPADGANASPLVYIFQTTLTY